MKRGEVWWVNFEPSIGGEIQKRRPAVIVLHGTGGTKEGARSWLEELAAKGFIAVAIDGRYHGERSRGGTGTVAYNAAIVRA